VAVNYDEELAAIIAEAKLRCGAKSLVTIEPARDNINAGKTVLQVIEGG
jgi:hypothetical protein